MLSVAMEWVVRAEYEVFLQLRRTREGAVCFAPAATESELAAAGQPPVLHDGAACSQASRWSDTYRARLHQHIADDTVNALWGLTTMVMALLETDDLGHVNASAAVVDWYARYMMDEAYLRSKVDELLTGQMHLQDDADLAEVCEFFLEAMERGFLAGKFELAAETMEALMTVLRRGDGTEGNPFSAEMESCFADIKRLLCSPVASPAAHQAWQMAANNQIYDAKRILGDAAPDDAASPRRRLAATFCLTSLHLLLMMSGDATLIGDRCVEARLSLFDHLTAVCAIAYPFASLPEVSALYAQIRADWRGDGSDAWLHSIGACLLQATALDELMAAMSLICDIAEMHFASTPHTKDTPPPAAARGGAEHVHETCNSPRPPSHDAFAQRSCDASNRVHCASRVPQRYFALVCMAAHVADLCTPYIVGTPDKVGLTLQRNALMQSYIALLDRHPRLWKVAGVYAAHSLLINPKILYNITMYAARLASADDAAYRTLTHFMQTVWRRDSVHQVVLRRVAKARLPESRTLDKWFAAMEYYYDEACTTLHERVVAAHFGHGAAARALWSALHAGRPALITPFLREQLGDRAVLRSNAVQQIGMAVRNGYVDVNGCTSVEMTCMLMLCAALTRYKASYTLLQDRGCVTLGEPSSEPSRRLRLSLQCVETIQLLFAHAMRCGPLLHPAVVCSIVECATDLVGTIGQATREMRDSCAAADAAVATAATTYITDSALAPLLYVLEVARIHGGLRGGEGDDDVTTEVRAATAKLAQALDVF